MFCCDTILDLFEGVHAFLFLENSPKMLRGLSSVATPGTDGVYCTPILSQFHFGFISSCFSFFFFFSLREGFVYSQRSGGKFKFYTDRMTV